MREFSQIFYEKMRMGLVIPGVIVAIMLASLALLANAAITGAQTPNRVDAIDARTANGTILRVTGIGVVRYTPDQAIVSIGVLGRAETASEALGIASEKIGRVIQALEDIGISRDDMKTTSINVYPQYNWEVRPPILVGYEASYTLMVKVRDVGKVGEAIDAAAKAGADNLWGVMFTLSEKAELRLREAALKLALDDARTKAKIVAEELGLDEIKVLEISLNAPFPNLPEPRPVVIKETAQTPIIPGEGQITISISVVFLLT